MNNKSNLVFMILTLAIFVVGGFLVYKNGAAFLGARILPQNINKETDLETLAQCLEAKDVKMYGASWCAACLTQQQLFRDLWQHINYIDCSEYGTGALSPNCRSEHIRSLPTWIFPGNLREEGELTIKEIAVLSGCGGG